MKKTVQLSPSLMCVRTWDLPEYIAAFEEAGVASLHFDVMDGHFVPNIMLGTSLYRDIAELTRLPVDIHLMCDEPERFVDYFSPRETDWVSFHAGAACRHPYRLLQKIRERGSRAGLALSPGTPIEFALEAAGALDFVLVMAVNPGFAGQIIVPDHFDKLSRLCDALRGKDIDIYVDGNTTAENAGRMIRAGASGVVLGSTSRLLTSAEAFRAGYPEYLEQISQ